MTRPEHQNTADFRISPVLFIICSFFLLAGAGVSIIDDSELGDMISVISDSLVFAITLLCIILYFTRKLKGNTGLGLMLYASAANFVVEYIQSMILAEHALPSQIFFLMLGIVIFQGVAGFIINRWGSVIVGTIATGLLLWSSITVKDPYFQQVNILTMIVVVGYSVIVIYYRLSLDRILASLRDANSKLQEQRDESERLRGEAESSLAELRKAQKKIISQEKLASLGAMTAGIAHEIKNPLNFITNFSESSLELMTELKEYFDKYRSAIGEEDQGEVAYLMGELEQNMKDINNHGKRGDHIVRSMLMHSRSGNSAFTPEDLNVLAEECLNLSFHGLRAQDQEFQSERVFVPCKELGTIDLVRGDMGRVLINLCGNAFYSVHQKRKKNPAGYKPRVSVEVRDGGSQAIMIIEDNGMGMSEEVRNKLFTPFFTTKPTGEGTGLGLSMSHEILVQEHGGEVKVESIEGEFARFTLSIPKKNTSGGMA